MVGVACETSDKLHLGQHNTSPASATTSHRHFPPSHEKSTNLPQSSASLRFLLLFSAICPHCPSGIRELSNMQHTHQPCTRIMKIERKRDAGIQTHCTALTNLSKFLPHLHILCGALPNISQVYRSETMPTKTTSTGPCGQHSAHNHSTPRVLYPPIPIICSSVLHD